MSNIEQAKETWAEYQAESSFDDWKFVTGVLREHFFSQVENMNEQEFKDYLENELDNTTSTEAVSIRSSDTVQDSLWGKQFHGQPDYATGFDR